MARGFQVTFDAADPARLGAFWGALLGYIEQPPPPGHDTWQSALQAMGVPEELRNSAYALIDPDGTGPRLFFKQVPEAKTAKNRVHLDVDVSGGLDVPLDERRIRVEEQAQRAVELGATRLHALEELGGYHVTLQDPEGNELCLQ